MEAEVIEQQDPGKAYSEIQVLDSNELTKARTKKDSQQGESRAQGSEQTYP